MNDFNKQNRLTLQKRVSLRLNDEFYSKNTSRASMPTRKQSLVSSYASPQVKFTPQPIITQSKPCLAPCLNVHYVEPIRKSTILCNLMQKLTNQQQQLKQIIGSKIDGKNEIVYNLNLNHCQSIQSKLANRQLQLQKCKQMVANLNQKISLLQKKNTINTRNKASYSIDFGTQTGDHKQQNTIDFYENLEQTLKLLSSVKKK